MTIGSGHIIESLTEDLHELLRAVEGADSDGCDVLADALLRLALDDREALSAMGIDAGDRVSSGRLPARHATWPLLHLFAASRFALIEAAPHLSAEALRRPVSPRKTLGDLLAAIAARSAEARREVLGALTLAPHALAA